LKLWAEHAPMNYQHKYDLVEAEKLRILGQLEAIEFYDKAIAGARENEYLNEEALSCELAANFFLEKKMNTFAQTYMIKAHQLYKKWGATAKVKHLEDKYPYLLSYIHPETTPHTPSIYSTSEIIDLNSILKASQALSEEIVLKRLLEKMIRIVIENAGAEKGILLLPQKKNWFIEAIGYADQSETIILQSILLEKMNPFA